MKARFPRYIPKGFTPVTRANIDAIVYMDPDPNNKPCAIGYIGKANRSAFNFFFRSPERRDEYINDFFERVQARDQYRIDRQAARREYTHTLQVGDVLYASWGYDQTNIDFVLVVRVPSNKTVAVREITGKSTGESGFMSGHVVPGYEFKKDSKEMIRKVGQGDRISIDDHSFGPWDGKPLYESWYA